MKVVVWLGILCGAVEARRKVQNVENCPDYANVGKYHRQLHGLKIGDTVVISVSRKNIIGTVDCGHSEKADVVCITRGGGECYSGEMVARASPTLVDVLKTQQIAANLRTRGGTASRKRSDIDEIRARRTALPWKVYKAGKTVSSHFPYCKRRDWPTHENLGRLEEMRFLYRLMVDPFPQMRDWGRVTGEHKTRVSNTLGELLNELGHAVPVSGRVRREWVGKVLKERIRKLDEHRRRLANWRQEKLVAVIHSIYEVQSIFPRVAAGLKKRLPGRAYDRIFTKYLLMIGDGFTTLVAYIAHRSPQIMDELPRIARSAYGRMVVSANDIELTECYKEDGRVRRDVRAILRDAEFAQLVLGVKSRMLPPEVEEHRPQTSHGRRDPEARRPETSGGRRQPTRERPQPSEGGRDGGRHGREEEARAPPTPDVGHLRREESAELAELTLVSMRRDVEEDIWRRVRAQMSSELGEKLRDLERRMRRSSEEEVETERRRLRALLQAELDRKVAEQVRLAEERMQPSLPADIEQQVREARRLAEECEKARAGDAKRIDSLQRRLDEALARIDALSNSFVREQATGSSGSTTVEVAVTFEETWAGASGYEVVFEEDQDYGGQYGSEAFAEDQDYGGQYGSEDDFGDEEFEGAQFMGDDDPYV